MPKTVKVKTAKRNGKTVKALRKSCCKSKKSGSGKEYESKKSDPCWEGYEQIGMKMKGGKKVPNCAKK